jgi:hypothetical protein
VLPQCGCDAGQSCAITDLVTGATECIKTGSGVEGQLCQDDLECGKGTSCIPGVCSAYCKTDADCSAKGGRCLAALYMDKDIPGYNFCTALCNPVDPANKAGLEGFTACDGSNCVHQTPGATYEGDTTCIGPAGKVADGQSCDSTVDCTAGAWCLEDASMNSSCKRLCYAQSDCPSMTLCTPFQYVKAGDEMKHIGYCEPYVCDAGDPCNTPPNTSVDGMKQSVFKGSYSLEFIRECRPGKPGCPAYTSESVLSYKQDDAMPSCQICVDGVAGESGLCTDDLDACNHDFGCVELYECYDKCASGETACFTQCGADHPGGLNLSQGYEACLCQACGSACEAECGG